MSDEDLQGLLTEQMSEVYPVFRDLVLRKSHDGQFRIEGTIRFSIGQEADEIRDAYDVRVTIPKEYPKEVPTVHETGGRIKGEHIYPMGRALCLGAPSAIYMEFQRKPTLLGFLHDQVVPYLYGCSYKVRHGKWPYGELAHGAKGLIQYYEDLFAVRSQGLILDLLKILAEDCDERLPCPCGSRRAFESCHGQRLFAIKPFVRNDLVRHEHNTIVRYLGRRDLI